MTNTPFAGGQNLGTATGRIIIDVTQVQNAVKAVAQAAQSITASMSAVNAALQNTASSTASGLKNAGQVAQNTAKQINNMATSLNKADTGAKRLNSTFERLAEYVFSFSAIFSAVNFAGQALQAARSIETANIRFNQLTGSAAQSRVEMEKIRDTAQEFGVPVNQAMDLFAGLVPLIENGRSSLEDYVKIMARMVLLSPEQGFQGAAFAIREALASLGEGRQDFVSLSERFEIPKGLLRTALDQSGGDLAAGMDLVLNKLGITEDAARSLGKTFHTSLSVMGDEFKRIAATAITPLLEGLTPVVRAMADFLNALTSTNPELVKSVGSIAAMVGSLGALKYMLSQLKAPINDTMKFFGGFVNPTKGWKSGVGGIASAFGSNLFGQGALGRAAGVGLPSVAIGANVGQGILGNIATMSDKTWEESIFKGGIFEDFRKTVRDRALKKVDELFESGAVGATEFINTQFGQSFNTQDRASRDAAREYAVTAFSRQIAGEQPGETLKMLGAMILGGLLTVVDAIRELGQTIGDPIERALNLIAGKGAKTSAEIAAEERKYSVLDAMSLKDSPAVKTLAEALGFTGDTQGDIYRQVEKEYELFRQALEKTKDVDTSLPVNKFAFMGELKTLEKFSGQFGSDIKILRDILEPLVNDVPLSTIKPAMSFQEGVKAAMSLMGLTTPSPTDTTGLATPTKAKEPVLSSDRIEAFTKYMSDLNRLANEYEEQRKAAFNENEIARQKIIDRFNAQRAKTDEKYNQDKLDREAELAQSIEDAQKDAQKRKIDLQIDFAEEEVKRQRDHLRRLAELNRDIADAAGKLDAIAVRRLQDQKAEAERTAQEEREERRRENNKRLQEEDNSLTERIDQLKLAASREQEIAKRRYDADIALLNQQEIEEQQTREAAFIEKTRQLKEQEDLERTARNDRYISELADMGDHNAKMIELLKSGNKAQQDEAQKFQDERIALEAKYYEQMKKDIYSNVLDTALGGNPVGDLISTFLKQGLSAGLKQFADGLMGANVKTKEGEIAPLSQQNALFNMGAVVKSGTSIFAGISDFINEIQDAIENTKATEPVIQSMREVKDRIRDVLWTIYDAIYAINDEAQKDKERIENVKSTIRIPLEGINAVIQTTKSFVDRASALAPTNYTSNVYVIRGFLQDIWNQVSTVVSWVRQMVARMGITGVMSGLQPRAQASTPVARGQNQFTQFATGTPNVMSGGLYQLHTGEGVANAVNASLLRGILGSGYTQPQLTQFLKQGGNGVNFGEGAIVLNINGDGNPRDIKVAVKDAMAEVINEYVARRNR